MSILSLRPNKTIASAAIVAIFAAGVGILAAANKGFATTDVELDDSGVWVTKTSDHLIGRLNHQAQALDGALRTMSGEFDVIQSGKTVLAQDNGDNSLAVIDPAGLTETGKTTLPAAAQVGLGGSAVTILDAVKGEAWAMPADAITGFASETSAPSAKDLAGGVLAVAPSGTAYIAQAAKGRLTRIDVDDGGKVTDTSSDQLADVQVKDELAITTVGDRAVVLDRTRGTLLLPDGKTARVADAKHAALQQPGPAADTVTYASGEALVRQPLDGSAATTLAAGAEGDPARPVFVGGCAYGAWNGSDRFVRDCAGKDHDSAQKIDGVSGDLAFRVNWGIVVLNDTAAGGVWLTDDKLIKVDDWRKALPDKDQGDEESDTPQETLKEQLPDRSEKNRPPIAVDDDFGVRAGRTTLLPVTENDSDPDGDVLTVSLVGKPPTIGEIQSVQTGSSLQIIVPKDATGSDTFRYQADDGRGGKAQATVTLHVVPDSQNTKPKQLREAVVRVAQGTAADYNLLSDWIDPDGDPLYLAGATATTDGDEVRFRADGTVSFQDAGKATGRKRVTVQVSDGRAVAEGTVTFDVRAAGSMVPVVNPDHYAVNAGETLTARPLANDSDPQGKSLRLVKVDEIDGVDIQPDFRAGTFTLRTEQTGVYYLTYAAANDAGSTVGLVRVDVLPPETKDLAPIAVADTAVLPVGGSVLSGVLANDEDPKGGVLVLQSVDVPEDAPISVAVLNHELLRISEIRAFDKPFEFSYTVSNGTLTAVGTVTVISAPAPAKLQPPVAVDDEATVRAGDIVTIPVMKNDTHPDNAPFTLVPTLTEQPDKSAGLIFTTTDTVRFQAADKPGTYSAIYQITDGQNVDAAKITIHVTAPDPAHNSPPVPQRLTARAIAGSDVRIPIPLDGIDPDGDSVYLVGQASAPTKGLVTEVGANYIVYRAGEDASGTDAFTYQVRDRLGAVGTGSVVIGIAQPSEINHPPTPTDDIVKVRPGRTVAVAVLTNDTDPDGDPLNVDPTSATSEDGIAVQVKSNRLVFTAPQAEGTYSVGYRAIDPYGASASATVTIEVSDKQPPARPIARDDDVPTADVAGKESVRVAVLDNDEDPDGATSDLTVSAGDGVSVNNDGSVTIPVTQNLQILPYTITDPDKLSAEAFIIVPGTTDVRPMLNPSAPKLAVKSGQPLAIDLTEQISVGEGKQVRITSDTLVSAHRGTVKVDGDQKVTFTSDENYFGPAGVTLEVTDGKSRDDAAGNKVVLTIPINVIAPDNRPPTFTSGQVVLAAGERLDVDLNKYAKDPDPGDQGKLTFTQTGQPPAGLTATLSGAILRLTAAESTPKGATATIGITVTDGHSAPVPGRIEVRVVGSTKPMPRAIDDLVDDAAQGKPVTVDVLANDYNPFPGKPLTLISAAVETGEGQAAVQGHKVLVTPGPQFTGTLVVRYRIGDATGDAARQVEGRIRVNVRGKPDAPTGVAVAEVGDGRVVLTWTAAAANGAPITGYTVTSDAGGSQECPATTCTVTGLTNGSPYTFSVVAHNDVGDSPPSPTSAPATPDAVPDTPAPPTLSFGDRSLTVAWSPPASRGTPVEHYDLRIVPAPPNGIDTKRGVSGTSLIWSGLENGVAYRVSVKAYNSLPGGSEWSASSGAEVPAGLPPAPGAPSLDLARGGKQTVISWSPLKNGNGDRPSGYVVYGSGAGGSIRVSVDGGSASSVTVDTPASADEYQFAVSAINKVGEGPKSGWSAPLRVTGKLSGITGISKDVGDGAATITFDSVSGEGVRDSEIAYYYEVDGSRGSCGSSPSCHVTGLSNGETYTVTLIAQADVGGKTLKSTKEVTGIKPYGPIRDLDESRLTWTPDGTTGTFSWPTNFSFLTNGRAISSVEVKVDGKTTANDGSDKVPDKADTSHTLAIKVCAGDSGCTSASISGTTGAAPEIEIEQGVDVGDTLFPDYYYVGFSYQNLPKGKFTYKCLVGPSGTDAQAGSGTVDTMESGSYQPDGQVDNFNKCWANLDAGDQWVEVQLKGNGVDITTGKVTSWP